MPDAIFAHPRLAPIYDAFDGGRDDLAAYLSIANELGADRVLDVGCGTGCLAVLLAESGRTVVGVDPAAASLEVAKSKDATGRITWVHGDATAVPEFGADLAVMTGNVAQVFLTDEDWARTLRGIAAALRPGGYLVFESRRPGRRAWEEWAADTSPVSLDIPGIGSVERRSEVTDVSLPFVSFRDTYRFLVDGMTVTSDSTLRFRSRDDVESSLVAQGYRVLDVREAPDRPGREFVFIAESTIAQGAGPPGSPRSRDAVVPWSGSCSMHVVDVVIFAGWLAFWIYWLAAAVGVKSGHTGWTRFAGFRVGIILVVLLLVRTGVFKGHAVISDPWLQGIGLAVFLLGLALAVWARVYLGRNWGMPMSQKADPELITTGPYRSIRHPIYSGIILAMIGTTVASSVYWLVAVASIGAYFSYSAITEERFMASRFPESYPEYKRSTKMLIPFLL